MLGLQRKVEEEIVDQEKQLVRHQRRDQQRVAGYNAIRSQLDQFEERREQLQERVREGILSDEMCEDLATLNRRVAEYKVLLADAHKELEKVVDQSLITKTKAAEVAEAAANSPAISPQQLRRRGGITPDMAAVATKAYDAMPQLKVRGGLRSHVPMVLAW
jgi:peptidoglycan hydrolase CwlO-like protein